MPNFLESIKADKGELLDTGNDMGGGYVTFTIARILYMLTATHHACGVGLSNDKN